MVTICGKILEGENTEQMVTKILADADQLAALPLLMSIGQESFGEVCIIPQIFPLQYFPMYSSYHNNKLLSKIIIAV